MKSESARIVITKENPQVSVIIPSLDGYRDGNVPRLLDDLRAQTFQDFEVIVIKGVSPNGRARNVGVKKASGQYLVSIDDDVRLGDDKVIENLIAPFINNESASGGNHDPRPIGLTGASQLIPKDSNWFQKKAAQELPRTSFPIVDQITETDMVSHMCLALPIQLYKDIGWESNELLSGTDPDLRYRVRQAGYKIVVVPYTWAYHPLPISLGQLLRQCYSTGWKAGWGRQHYPHLIYELADSFVSDFKPQRSFAYRIIRFVLQIVKSAMMQKWIYLTVRGSYGLGYINFWISHRRR